MVSVLRLENEQELGPYVTGCWREYCGNPDYSNIHPDPKTDSNFIKAFDKLERPFFIESFFSDYMFGFSGKRQYLQWVYDPEWRVLLECLDFKLNRYEVDESDYIEGEKQCIFKKDNAILTHSYKPTMYDF